MSVLGSGFGGARMEGAWKEASFPSLVTQSRQHQGPVQVVGMGEDTPK